VKDYRTERIGNTQPLGRAIKSTPEEVKNGATVWRLSFHRTGVTFREHEDDLQRILDVLNTLEEARAYLKAELQEVEETCKSLREDLSNFSTFEQICNSGMLRNFKIDSESEFAKVILSLLQRTMELQIDHLQAETEPNSPEGGFHVRLREQ